MIDEKQKFQKAGGEELHYTFDGIGSDSIVFDIGLYKGAWAKEIIQRYDPYLYGFEPVRGYFLRAQKNLEEYPKVKLFNFGLGRTNRNVIFAVKRNKSRPIRRAEKPTKTESVEIKSIEEFMSGLDMDFIDLASVNIEGSEYELLDFMFSSGLIMKFGALLIQFHDIGVDSRYRRENIRTLLGLTHKKVYCYDWVWELWKKK